MAWHGIAELDLEYDIFHRNPKTEPSKRMTLYRNQCHANSVFACFRFAWETNFRSFQLTEQTLDIKSMFVPFTFSISKLRRICSSISAIRLAFSWLFILFDIIVTTTPSINWSQSIQNEVQQKQKQTKHNFSVNYLNELCFTAIESFLFRQTRYNFIYTLHIFHVPFKFLPSITLVVWNSFRLSSCAVQFVYSIFCTFYIWFRLWPFLVFCLFTERW